MAIGGASDPADARRFSLDDADYIEKVERVEFAGSTGTLLYQLCRPFSDYSPSLSCPSKIYIAERGSQRRLAFPQANEGAYRITSVSPSGRFVTFTRSLEGRTQVGIFDLGSRTVRYVSLAPRYSEAAPQWTSDNHFVSGASLVQEPSDSAGIEPRVLGAGQHAQSLVGTSDFGLHLVTAETGESTQFAHGAFRYLALSPDRTRLAAIRTSPAASGGSGPVTAQDVDRGELSIFHINELPIRQQIVCAECDVSPRPLSWSPASTRLAFFSRRRGELWRDGRVTVVDVDSGQISRHDQGGDRAHSDVGRIAPLIVWLGDRLAFQRRSGEAVVLCVVRGASACAPLTRLVSPPTAIIASTRSGVVVTARDGIWKIAPDGRRRRVAPLRNLEVLARSDDSNAAWPVILGRPGRANSSPALYWFDPASERLSRLADGVGVAAAVDPRRPAALLRRTATNVDSFFEVDGSRAQASLRLNERFSDVEWGSSIPISYTDRAGRRLTSWMILPPGYQPGSGPLPTVVMVYPGTTFDQRLPREFTSVVDAPSYFRPQMFSARGYAVLLASAPIGPIPRDPLVGLADQILQVVDQGIDRGYIDGERMAVTGQSFGGSAVAAILTQTNRFKAAIAHAGAYDLVQLYGNLRAYSDQQPGLGIDRGPTLAGPILLEGGYAGLGSPPWADPERYVRNSPIFSASAIHTPIMIVHGEEDQAVDSTQADALFVALFRLNRDAIYIRYPNQGHALLGRRAVEDYWQRAFQWLDRYLGRLQRRTEDRAR